MRRTEHLGRCGAATPQRLSLSLASLPDEWCPEPDSPFVPLRFCRPQCYVIEIPDHGQVQHALPGVNVRDVRYPFAVWLACVKVPVHAKTAFPLLCNHFRKSRVLFRPAQTMDKSIVAASGHSKEFAHDCHWILCPVTIDDMILYLCSHFLSVKRRKSRSGLFSMRSR